MYVLENTQQADCNILFRAVLLYYYIKIKSNRFVQIRIIFRGSSYICTCRYEYIIPMPMIVVWLYDWGIRDRYVPINAF